MNTTTTKIGASTVITKKFTVTNVRVVHKSTGWSDCYDWYVSMDCNDGSPIKTSKVFKGSTFEEVCNGVVDFVGPLRIMDGSTKIKYVDLFEPGLLAD